MRRALHAVRVGVGGVLLAACLASASCAGPSGDAGSCVAPTLHVEGATGEPPTVVLPGPLVVVGEWFRDGCDDTGGPSTEVADTDVELTLEQNGQVWSLGTADATGRESGYSITWAAQPLPSDLAPMPAVLRAGSAELEIYFSIP